MDISRRGAELILNGDINNRTVNGDLYRRWAELLGDCPDDGLTLTFENTKDIDSTCVALLIDAKRRLEGKTLTVRDAPPTLRDLLSLYRLNDWIMPE